VKDRAIREEFRNDFQPSSYRYTEQPIWDPVTLVVFSRLVETVQIVKYSGKKLSQRGINFFVGPSCSELQAALIHLSKAFVDQNLYTKLVRNSIIYDFQRCRVVVLVHMC
jgi:hypothetical protein